MDSFWRDNGIGGPLVAVCDECLDNAWDKWKELVIRTPGTTNYRIIRILCPHCYRSKYPL